jgi:hypothetical protein
MPYAVMSAVTGSPMRTPEANCPVKAGWISIASTTSP